MYARLYWSLWRSCLGGCRQDDSHGHHHHHHLIQSRRWDQQSPACATIRRCTTLLRQGPPQYRTGECTRKPPGISHGSDWLHFKRLLYVGLVAAALGRQSARWLPSTSKTVSKQQHKYARLAQPCLSTLPSTVPCNQISGTGVRGIPGLFYGCRKQRQSSYHTRTYTRTRAADTPKKRAKHDNRTPRGETANATNPDTYHSTHPQVCAVGLQMGGLPAVDQMMNLAYLGSDQDGERHRHFAVLIVLLDATRRCLI